jgi:hypothetical protein
LSPQAFDGGDGGDGRRRGLFGLRKRARSLAEHLLRLDVPGVDKAFVIAQRSLVTLGLGERMAVTRRDVWQLETAPPAGPAGELVVRTAAARDLDGVCAVIETPLALVHERLRNGDWVYVGLLDGIVVCHLWFHRGPRPFTEDEHTLARWALPASTVWCFGHGATPVGRDTSLRETLYRTALRDAFTLHGAAAVQTATSSANSASRLLHESLGFRRLGHLMGFATPWLRTVIWQGETTRTYVLGPQSGVAVSFPPALA